MWEKHWPIRGILGGGLLIFAAAIFTVSAEPSAETPRKPAEWPMWGGAPSRNMVSPVENVDLNIEVDLEDLAASESLLWSAPLGDQTYSSPVVSQGRVLIGTNNGQWPEAHGDKGVLLCFDAEHGECLWRLTRDKHPRGRLWDWPEQGICSTACIEGDRVWITTNRCELVCLDLHGFHDKENDGPFVDEGDSDVQSADIVWLLDMTTELDVAPHCMSPSCPVVHGEQVFIVTGNGVDAAHREVQNPKAPSFLAVNKRTGEVIWKDSTPSTSSKAPEPYNTILHGSWGSPSIGEVNGQSLVFMPGGDGVLYAFTSEGDGQGGGELVWWFDCNPKESQWQLGGRGERNNLIATPVFYANSVLIGTGQEPEHGSGVAYFYRIDATKRGDISPTLISDIGKIQPNPNSGMIWQFGGRGEHEKFGLRMCRTLSTSAVSDGLVYVPDINGLFHCLDLQTGQELWEHDLEASAWGSPLVVDGRVIIGDEDGELAFIPATRQSQERRVWKATFPASIYTTAAVAGKRLYIADRRRLYCFDIE